jgi:hypothetical protein
MQKERRMVTIMKKLVCTCALQLAQRYVVTLAGILFLGCSGLLLLMRLLHWKRKGSHTLRNPMLLVPLPSSPSPRHVEYYFGPGIGGNRFTHTFSLPADLLPPDSSLGLAEDVPPYDTDALSQLLAAAVKATSDVPPAPSFLNPLKVWDEEFYQQILRAINQPASGHEHESGTQE